MPIFHEIRGPVPRWVKVMRIWDTLRLRHIRGGGAKSGQRRTLLRLQKFERMRREECPA
jgi:hypothetical protein